jgi:UDP-glucose:(heptosyl)LPS alpha-1,3-glucosyltransferase
VKFALVHRRFGLDGGTERFLEGLTRGLHERGHEIEVFCADVDPRFRRARVASFKGLLSRGPSSFLRALLLFVTAAIRVRPARYDAVLHLGRTGPMDVYRAGGGCHRTWVELLQGRATGLAALRLTLSFKHRFLLWHEKRALTSGARVVVPSQQARADMQAAYGAAAADVEVIPNGTDLDRFHPKGRSLFFQDTRAKLGLRPEELVLLFVGSDFWRKGLDCVLHALTKLEGDYEDLRLLVVGDDRARDDFSSQAEALGLRGLVTFLPSHDSPEKLYAACDLVVLPTRHDPFANVTLEALACGVPVVTSAVNGAVEAIGACSAVRVVEDPEDAAGIAAGIAELLDPARAAELRLAARATAEACGEGLAVARWESLLTTVGLARE